MKQLFFVCPYLDNKLSAASSYILNIAITLSNNHHVVIYAKQSIDALNRYPNIEQRRLRNFPSTRIYALILIQSLLLKYHNSRIISDINPFLTFFKFRRLYHIIHHINDIPFLSHQDKSTDTYLGLLQLNSLLYLSKLAWSISLIFSPTNIITVSNTVKNDILDIKKRKNISIIRNFNPLENFAQTFPADSEKKYHILMIGNNIPRKNYPFAIDIINKVANTYHELYNDNLKVCIVGAFSERLRNHFNHNVYFSSQSNIPDMQLAEIISNSCIFLNTSTQEGFCIPFIEAQSFLLHCVVPHQPIFIENKFTKNVHCLDYDCISFVNTINEIIVPLPKFTRITYPLIDNKHSLFLNKSIRDSITNYFI